MSNYKKVVAVDFDGTIVQHKYPLIGEPVAYALDTLRWFMAHDIKIILYTMRSGPSLDEAVAYLEANDIELYGVNENPEQKTWTASPKVYANYYIDDAAVGSYLIPQVGERPIVNWKAVKHHLESWVTGVNTAW